MELRVRDNRVVLVSAGEQTIDPAELPVDEELVEALREWAVVAATIAAASMDDRAAGEVVTRRGRQLAGRLAAAIDAPVSYSDPLTGAWVMLGAPAAQPARVRVRSAEPTPWATGLTVSALVGCSVAFAMVVLCGAVTEASKWFAFAANVVVTAGLAPTVVLARRLLVWRWVALGIAAGLVAGWLAWLFSLL